MKQKALNFQEKLAMVAFVTLTSIGLLFLAPYVCLALGVAIAAMMFISAGNDTTEYHKFYNSRGFTILLMHGWALGFLLFLLMFSLNLIILLLVGFYVYSIQEKLKSLSVNLTY